MDVIKLGIARRQVKVIQLRLVVDPRRHFMKAPVQIAFNKAAQLIDRRKRLRIELHSLLRSRIETTGTANAFRNLIPSRNHSSIVAH
ncbi:hypothetical protein A7975_19640 [Bacillus sp. FJAT-26390]|nr:hypothetical protein A7975_19640 [Bacillus sp. FJAT-26390]